MMHSQNTLSRYKNT